MTTCRQPRRLLTALPAEILHDICALLPTRDVRRFRLACRRIAAIAAEYALPELVVYTHVDDLHYLRGLCAHPVYPRFVRSLVCVGDMLDCKSMLSFKAYLQCRRLTETLCQKAREFDRREYLSNCRQNNSTTTPLGSGRACGRTVATRRRRMPMVPRSVNEAVTVKTVDEVRESYGEYKRIYNAQADILERKIDYQDMRDAVANMPNLEDVTISADWAFRESSCGQRCRHDGITDDAKEKGRADSGEAHRCTRSPFDSLYCGYAADAADCTGLRQVTIMLEALDHAEKRRQQEAERAKEARCPSQQQLDAATADGRGPYLSSSPPGPRLRSFRAGVLHWSFFLGHTFNLSRFGDLCANLTRFEVCIKAAPDENEPEDTGFFEDQLIESEHAYEVRRCRMTMSASAGRPLCALLRRMPHLEVLSIQFSAHHDPNQLNMEAYDLLLFPARQRDVLPDPAKFHWPNLERLRLENIECATHRELLDFLVRHKESLTHINLRDIKIAKGSWLTLLPLMKVQLETELMDEVTVEGVIYGESQANGNTADGWNVFVGHFDDDAGDDDDNVDDFDDDDDFDHDDFDHDVFDHDDFDHDDFDHDDFNDDDGDAGIPDEEWWLGNPTYGDDEGGRALSLDIEEYFAHREKQVLPLCWENMRHRFDF